MRRFAVLAALAATALPGRSGLAQAPPAPPAAEQIAPDIKPEALWDGRKLAPFHAADNPEMVRAAAADLIKDGEYVLGITGNGESRAYPARYLAWHHVVNDHIGLAADGGSVPVTVTY